MKYEVHYCNPFEFQIFQKDENDDKLFKENKEFKTFLEAKKYLLLLLRRDREVFNETIKKANSLQIKNCSRVV